MLYSCQFNVLNDINIIRSVYFFRINVRVSSSMLTTIAHKKGLKIETQNTIRPESIWQIKTFITKNRIHIILIYGGCVGCAGIVRFCAQVIYEIYFYILSKSITINVYLILKICYILSSCCRKLCIKEINVCAYVYLNDA